VKGFAVAIPTVKVSLNDARRRAFRPVRPDGAPREGEIFARPDAKTIHRFVPRLWLIKPYI
jgi:hypothetical protein